jgi:hypothetical protein
MADFAFGSIRPNYELRGCVANTVAPSNAQERLHAVKRTLPDREALLHGPSTLSRLIARGKRPYVWLANQARR